MFEPALMLSLLVLCSISNFAAAQMVQWSFDPFNPPTQIVDQNGNTWTRYGTTSDDRGLWGPQVTARWGTYHIFNLAGPYLWGSISGSYNSPTVSWLMDKRYKLNDPPTQTSSADYYCGSSLVADPYNSSLSYQTAKFRCYVVRMVTLDAYEPVSPPSMPGYTYNQLFGSITAYVTCPYATTMYYRNN